MAVVVAGEKIVSDLLSPDKSKGKSAFFLMFGYKLDNWTRLRDDISRLGSAFPRPLKRETVFGKKYEVTGEIAAPIGRKMTIKTAWLAAHDAPETIRFVTAYPA